MAELDPGWITSIVLGAIIVVMIVAIVVWVFMRRKGNIENVTADHDNETVEEHEDHSISKHVNDRWDALMKSWEEENHYKRV